jgi:uncharacterized iron-regulated membrane protein
MCVTGVLLSFEKQITAWADTRSYRSAPPTPNEPDRRFVSGLHRLSTRDPASALLACEAARNSNSV